MAEISMSEAEKLMADVPAQDPHFVLAVMARIEQRRFRRELARTGALAAAAALLQALVMPQLVAVTPELNTGRLSDLLQQNNIAVAGALMALTIALPYLARR